MKENTLKDLKAMSIKQRRESDSWNYRIASDVLARKAGRRKRSILIFSMSPVAAAVLFFIVFSFSGFDEPADLYGPFIANQLEGTYSAVFKNNTAAGTGYSSDPLFTNDIDIMIDETLAMR